MNSAQSRLHAAIAAIDAMDPYEVRARTLEVARHADDPLLHTIGVGGLAVPPRQPTITEQLDAWQGGVAFDAALDSDLHSSLDSRLDFGVGIDTGIDIDIDIDISGLLGHTGDEPIMLNDTWYLLSRDRDQRPPALQNKLDSMFNNAMLYAQWRATRRRALDRRRAIRVPLLSRVHVDGVEMHMTSTDLSLSGLRCSGEPTAAVMDIEFKLPGLHFPIDARAEVVSFKESNVAPLVGLRFASIDKPYRDHIARYINDRRVRDIERQVA